MLIVFNFRQVYGVQKFCFRWVRVSLFWWILDVLFSDDHGLKNNLQTFYDIPVQVQGKFILLCLD